MQTLQQIAANKWNRSAAAVSLALILVEVLRWPLVSWLTVFLEPAFELAVLALFTGTLLATFVHAIRQQRTGVRTGWQAFFLCVGVAAMVWFVPFDVVYLKANFYFHQRRRSQVSEQMIAGRYGHIVQSGGRGDLIALDRSDRLLSSDGGEVFLDRRGGKAFVLFFTFRGVLDHFAGYVYSPSDTPPASDEFMDSGREINRVAPRWFWYSSY